MWKICPTPHWANTYYHLIRNLRSRTRKKPSRQYNINYLVFNLEIIDILMSSDSLRRSSWTISLSSWTLSNYKIKCKVSDSDKHHNKHTSWKRCVCNHWAENQHIIKHKPIYMLGVTQTQRQSFGDKILLFHKAPVPCYKQVFIFLLVRCQALYGKSTAWTVGKKISFCFVT